MPGRKAKKPKEQYQRLIVRVEAVAARVSRIGPDIYAFEPKGAVSSTIAIEGKLDRPVLKTLQDAHVTVFEREEREGNPGSAIGGSIRWNVVCSLHREQFSDLLAVVLADKLSTVDMVFADLRRGRGTLRTISLRN